jgi:hypothetical protein
MSDLGYSGPDLMDEAIRLYEKREAARAAAPDVLSLAFPAQREFITFPSNLKMAFCTRRSAKSYSGGLYAFYEAVNNPGCNVLITGLTRASVKGIFWKDILKDINDKLNIGARPNQADLTLTLPNGSMICLTGIDDNEDEMKKVLGRKYRLVLPDEGSMYSINLRNFIYGVLRPAMVDPNVDGQRGTIALLGTASDFARGLFYDISVGKEKGWAVSSWTAFDNPHVAKQWAEELDEIKRDRPEYMETPQFKQWYLNQWVVDQDKLCYKFNPEINLVKELPKGLDPNGWIGRVLGVDLGWDDDNAFVLTAYHENDPCLYILKYFSKNKMTFNSVDDRVNEYKSDPWWSPNRIIIDGADKQGVESMRERSQNPYEAADKHDKATFIELMNADFTAGKIKVMDTPENEPLWRAWMALVWQTDGDKVVFPKKENKSLHHLSHGPDAALYAWRCGYHYHSQPKKSKTLVGRDEWIGENAKKAWSKYAEQLQEQRQAQEEFGHGFDSDDDW